MRNKKHIIMTVMVGTLALGLLGCSGATSADNEGTEESESVSVAENQDEENTEYVDSEGELKTITIATATSDGIMTDVARIAQEEGFFEEELALVGYEADYQGFAQAGPAINEAFASEDVDVAIYGDLPAVTAKSNDIDIKVVASVNSNMDLALVVGENSGITSAVDLEGKQIAAGTGTITYQYLENLLKKSSLSISDVEVVNTSVDGPSMLAGGQIDGFVTQLNAALMYEQQGIGNIAVTSQGDEELSSQMLLVARTAYLESDREAVVAVVKALYDAYVFAQENPEQAYADLVTDYADEKIQKQVYEDTTFESFDPTIDDLTFSKTGSTEQFQEENGLISASVDINDLIDSSITEEVSVLYK